jgi:hypothetical protein
MRVFLRKSGIISTWKAYQIKGNIEAANKDLFDEQLALTK